MRFCGLFVLPCLAVLVPGGALATLLSAAAATALLVPGGALATLLPAAAATKAAV